MNVSSFSAHQSSNLSPLHLILEGSVWVFPLPFVSLAEAADVTFDESVAPFLKSHCHGCHGAEKQKARIRYDQITGYREDDQHLWTTVHEMLSDREMPPEDRPQPDDAERKAVLTWIESQQAASASGTFSARLLGTPGTSAIGDLRKRPNGADS